MVTLPTVNVGVSGQNYYGVLNLKITGLLWNISKIFDIHVDVADNWMILNIITVILV